jgi:hypothetical protein
MGGKGFKCEGRWKCGIFMRTLGQGKNMRAHEGLRKYRRAGFVVGAIATVSAAANALLAFVPGVAEIALQGNKPGWKTELILAGVAALGAVISWAKFRQGYQTALKRIDGMASNLETAMGALEENAGKAIAEIEETWSGTF